jgi:hypothetical protein
VGIEKRTVKVLRDLARQYREICDSDRNRSNIELWRALNSRRQLRPLVWANVGLLGPDIDAALPRCEIAEEDLSKVAHDLQKSIWIAGIGDDMVFNPWYTVRAVVLEHPEGVWGLPRNTVRDPSSRGWRDLPAIRSESDLGLLEATPHRVVDPEPPLARRLADIFGDILPVHIDRSSVYPRWGGTDLSEAAGRLLGLEELLYALYDNPDLVHGLMSFMRDAVIDNLKQAERAGDFSTVENQNYTVPSHCDDLPDPAANSHGTRLGELCFFTHAQEFESVSPAQHEEFVLEYQLPVAELFARVNYGCCETLDNKLDLLSRIPNLNKVAAGPRADVGVYPEKVGDAIISWRPNAAPMVCDGFDENRIRSILQDGLNKTRGCSVEVHLHEPMTVEGDLSRVHRWVRIAIEEAERVA